MPLTKSIFCCHIRSEPMFPSAPTYQIAPWSSASATAQAGIQRAAVRHSWAARAGPDGP
jgi:hypothetical protein